MFGLASGRRRRCTCRCDEQASGMRSPGSEDGGLGDERARSISSHYWRIEDRVQVQARTATAAWFIRGRSLHAARQWSGRVNLMPRPHVRAVGMMTSDGERERRRSQLGVVRKNALQSLPCTSVAGGRLLGRRRRGHASGSEQEASQARACPRHVVANSDHGRKEKEQEYRCEGQAP